MHSGLLLNGLLQREPVYKESQWLLQQSISRRPQPCRTLNSRTSGDEVDRVASGRTASFLVAVDSFCWLALVIHGYPHSGTTSDAEF